MSASSQGDVGELVDSHVHFWDLGLHRFRWLDPDLPPTKLMGDLTPIRRNYLLEDYLSDARPACVTKIVHVEAGIEPVDAVRNTIWLQDLATKTGYPQAIVALVALESPDLQETLEAHGQAANLRGVRQALNWVADPAKYHGRLPDRLTNSAWRAGFALLRPLGLSFDMQLDPAQMPEGAELARAFPESLIIVDHVGMPVDRSAKGMELWRHGMRLLAAQPNVAVKISGLAMIDPGWTLKSIRPLVRETIEMFGVNRVMFGSNFPVDKLNATLPNLISAIRAATADLTPGERRQLFSQNALHWYRIIEP